MIETDEQAPETRYLKYLRDIPDPPPGLSKLDTGHVPTCPLGYFTAGERTEHFPRHHDELIGQGWAVGRDEAGLARVFLPSRYSLRGFLGFAVANHGLGAPRLCVTTRGRVVLRLDALTDQAIGAPVYATGPDTFTLTPGAFLVGRVAHLEGRDRAAVDFKRFDDPDPFRDLRYS